MTSLPPDDPLIALWKTAPKPDTHNLLTELQVQKRLHRRLNQSVFAIVCGIAMLLLFEEATGRVPSHGFLTMIWILVLGIGAIWERRVRCNRVDALTLDTVRLLRWTIAQAKRDLFVARCLYGGVPVGAAAGFVALKLAGAGASIPATAVPGNLRQIQTAAGFAALIIMMIAGAILARSRHAQVQDLSDKLESITAEL